MTLLRLLFGWMFRRREVLPAPDARCARGIEGEYMRSLKR